MNPQRLVLALSLTLTLPFMLHAEDIKVSVDPSLTPQPVLRQQLLDLDKQGKGPLDIATLAKFRALITQYGWPTVVAAGRDGVDAAGDLTFRSSTDYNYQGALETAMQNRLGTDIDVHAFAVLNDHIEQTHDNTQQLGSLLTLQDGKVVTSPHIGTTEANPLRDQLGLLPLDLYLKQVQAEVNTGANLASAMHVPRLSTESHVQTQPALHAELDAMAKEDQAIREAFIHSGLKAGSPEQQRMRDIDAKNLLRLRTIFHQYGFPDASMVGRGGVEDFWLLVQHATTDIPFMVKAVKLAHPLMLKGDISRSNYAMLVDRVRLKQHKKQIYGSQLKLRSGHVILLPLEDPTHVDQRRSEMGLPPLADYIRGTEAFYSNATTSHASTPAQAASTLH